MLFVKIVFHMLYFSAVQSCCSLILARLRKVLSEKQQSITVHSGRVILKTNALYGSFSAQNYSKKDA